MTINNEVYFKIKQNYILYIEPLQTDIPEIELEKNTPEVIKKIREESHKEQGILESLKRNYQDKELIKYLEIQNTKIQKILFLYTKNEKIKGTKIEGLEFGGSHISFASKNKLNQNQLLGATILIEKHLVAVYCIIKVIQVVSHQDKFEVISKIECINAEDREKLIRSSLQEQIKHINEIKVKE